MINYKPPSRNQPIFLAYLACIGFFLYNFIYQIHVDRNKVTYAVKELETNISELSICIDIKLYDCGNSISSEHNEKCMELNKLFSYIMNDNIYRTPKMILEKALEMNLSKYFSLEPDYEKSIYYLDARFLCIQYSLSESSFVLFNIYNSYSITCFIFLEEYDQSMDSHLFRFECDNFRLCQGKYFKV